MKIVGRVHDNGDPVIALRLRGPGGAVAAVDAILDTGFTNELALPASVIESLALQARESVHITLADGRLSLEPQYAVDVEFFGAWRGVLTIRMEGGPLVGMEFLGGCHLAMDVVPDGRIEIAPLH